jgi:hypothetical protein
MHKINGICHCKNLSYELVTEMEPAEIRLRACDCSFCRLHAARNWSDSNGKTTIRIKDKKQLQKYRFALKTADFYLCRECGIYLGAVLSDNDGTWSTVNLRLTGLPLAGEQVVNYDSEDAAGRITRRKRAWTPTTIIADT